MNTENLVNTSSEEWRSVVGFEGKYEVSTMGRVRSLDREVPSRYGAKRQIKGRVLKTPIPSSGYPTVEMGGKSYSVHRLVASAFISNEGGLPQVNHINGIKTDNRVSNLEWVSRSQNIQHGFEKGLFSVRKGHTFKKARISEAARLAIITCTNVTKTELAKIYKCDVKTIYLIRKRWEVDKRVRNGHTPFSKYFNAN